MQRREFRHRHLERPEEFDEQVIKSFREDEDAVERVRRDLRVRELVEEIVRAYVPGQPVGDSVGEIEVGQPRAREDLLAGRVESTSRGGPSARR